MKPLIVANWKANPADVGGAVRLAREIERKIAKFPKAEIIIAPPYPFLNAVGKVLKRSALGSQNVFWEDVGPYTGEVSWRQLKSIGVSRVIVGHSERKIYLGETDEMINKKVRVLLENGIRPVLCIGEREREGKEIPAVVGKQLKIALTGVKKSYINDLTVAYEPIWAISTMPGARADSPENAFRASVYIRKIISDLYDRKTADSVRVIYGGSVNSGNIAPFLREGKMQGALVGGASLKPDEFAKIIEIASRI